MEEKVLEFIKTVVIDEFVNLSREELEVMLNLESLRKSRGTTMFIGVNLRLNPLLNARSRPFSFPRSAWECITVGSADS